MEGGVEIPHPLWKGFMKQKNNCVFGDLTSLYSARSLDRKSINYEKLNSVILNHFNISSFKEISDNKFYTLFSDNNEKQINFVNGISKFGWSVETMNPREIPRHMKWHDYRFDARIAYQLAFSADKIMVLSDSFELYYPLKCLNKEEPKCELTLAFFSSSLDPRWKKVINSDDSFIKFLDLEKELYS